MAQFVIISIFISKIIIDNKTLVNDTFSHEWVQLKTIPLLIVRG